MSWKKCLYLNQSYPINYIEMGSVEHRRNPDETREDINIAVLRISSIAIFFCWFKCASSVEENIVPRTEWFSFIASFIGSFFYNDAKLGVTLKPNFLVLLFSYLFVPTVRTLTAEVCSDTIYAYFIVAQLVYVIDSVAAFISRNKVQTVLKDALAPLSLEESISIPKKKLRSQVMGHTSCFLGFVLLSSRLRKSESVFELFCIGLVTYVVFPIYFERIRIQKSNRRMAMLCASVSLLSLLSDRVVFCAYGSIVAYLYLVSHVSIWIFEKDLQSSR
jgi:phosphatidylinositol N-acetylglucosaminyltransferase subunit C